MNQNINIFIGSSVEGLEVARIIQEKLDYDGYSIWIWEDVYNLSTQTVERLEEIKNKYHFGIFILSADDIIIKRDNILWTARDNVILELGFFMGFIGRKKCFIVMPRNIEIDKPTDISGLTIASYDQKKPLVSALGPAINKIRNSIKEQLLTLDVDLPIHYYNYRNLDAYSEEVTNSKTRIWILSLRIRGFVEDHKSDNGERLLNALKNGTNIRILLFDPFIEYKESNYPITRTGEILSIFSGEGKSQATWEESLKRTMTFLNLISEKVTERRYSGTLEIKFHCSPIINMLYCIDDKLYFGPYLINSDHIKSPTFEINSQHQLFNRFINHFNELWNESRLTRKV
jgi:hypothetical protein